MRSFYLYLLCLAALLLNPTYSFPQKKKVDSLRNALSEIKRGPADNSLDTTRVNILNELAAQLRHDDPVAAMAYAKEALVVALKANYKYGIATSYARIGVMNKINSNYSESLINLEKSLQLYLELDDKKGIAACYNNIGLVYKEQGDYAKTLDAYFKCLKMCEQLDDSDMMIKILGNIGSTFLDKGDPVKSEEFQNKSLKIAESTNNKKGIASAYNNLGLCYMAQDKPAEALDAYAKSVALSEALNDKSYTARAYGNMGLVYQDQKDYAKALSHFEKTLAIKKELVDKTGIALWENNIGNLYLVQKNYAKAIDHYKQSIAVAEAIGYKPIMQFNYLKFSEAYTGLHDYEKALAYHLKYTNIKDSIFNETGSKQIAEMQTKYETEKKEKEIADLNKDKVVQSELLTKEKSIRYLLLSVISVVLIFGFVLLNRFALIRKQKKIIEVQKMMVEAKNQDITSSIEYAKRIQQALLPQEKYIDRTLRRLKK
jgi:tetratricopeptide (TPR) repeat protein